MLRRAIWLFAFTALLTPRGVALLPFLLVAYWLDAFSRVPGLRDSEDGPAPMRLEWKENS